MNNWIKKLKRKIFFLKVWAKNVGAYYIQQNTVRAVSNSSVAQHRPIPKAPVVLIGTRGKLFLSCYRQNCWHFGIGIVTSPMHIKTTVKVNIFPTYQNPYNGKKTFHRYIRFKQFWHKQNDNFTQFQLAGVWTDNGIGAL